MESTITKCDGCNFLSKEAEGGHVCPVCGTGVMTAEEDIVRQLLQELWNEYKTIIDKIADITDDQPFNEEPYILLTELSSDTEQMKALRDKLFDAGIKNIPGKLY